MVYYDTDSDSLAFAALADPRRRASIDRQASERQLAVLEIAPTAQSAAQPKLQRVDSKSTLDETARDGHERGVGRLEKLDQYLC
jgi:hypothetical protein